MVAVIGGGLTLIGRNPIGWLVDRWNDLRDVQQPVTTVTAVGVPDELPGFPAAAAIDGAIDTGWATNWPADQQPIAGCAPPAADAAPGTTGSLVVSLGASRKVKALRIFAGPGTPDRVNQPRPKTLQIGYTGGCADVDLADVAEVQTKELDFTTDAVWITVTSVWPSNAVQPVPQVQISEFEFLARPL